MGDDNNVQFTISLEDDASDTAKDIVDSIKDIADAATGLDDVSDSTDEVSTDLEDVANSAETTASGVSSSTDEISSSLEDVASSAGTTSDEVGGSTTEISSSLDDMATTAESASSSMTSSLDDVPAAFDDITSSADNAASAIQDVDSEAQDSSDPVSTMAGGLDGLGGALDAVTGAAAGFLAVDLVKGFTDRSTQLTNLSLQSGIAVGPLSDLQTQAQLTSVPFQSVTNSIKLMQQNLDGVQGPTKKAAAAMTDLGVNTNDFLKLSPEEQFLTLGDILQGVSNSGRKVSDAASLMGKSALQTFPLYKDGTLTMQGMADQADELGTHMDSSTAKMGDDTNTSVIKMGLAWKGLTDKLSGDIAPAFTWFFDDLTNGIEDLPILWGIVMTDLDTLDKNIVLWLKGLPEQMQIGLALIEAVFSNTWNHIVTQIETSDTIALEAIGNWIEGIPGYVESHLMDPLGKDFDTFFGVTIPNIITTDEKAILAVLETIGTDIENTVGNALKSLAALPGQAASAVGKFITGKGGGNAAGGDVSAGTMYTVGENGPETFIAPSNGQIIPSGQTVGGSSGGGQQVFNFVFQGPVSSKQAATQLLDQAFNAYKLSFAAR